MLKINYSTHRTLLNVFPEIYFNSQKYSNLRLFYIERMQKRKIVFDVCCLCFWWLVELPMWLTDGFLDTFFGRWRGAVRIHVSHVQLTCGINVHGNYYYMVEGSAHMWRLTCTVITTIWWRGALTCGD